MLAVGRAMMVAKRAYAVELGKVVLEGDPKDLRNKEHVKRAY
jgi:ABC-type lipopolysaccharide export system ATPase subunit